VDSHVITAQCQEPQVLPLFVTSNTHRPSHGLSLHRLAHVDYRDPDHAYFVTVCAIRPATPFVDPRLADAVIENLEWLRAHRGVRLYAYCLMPDHLHVLLQLASTDRSLGQIIASMKVFTTRAAHGRGHGVPLWQARFYDHILRRSEDGIGIATYILDNPVRKGLVDDRDAYPCSGTPDPF
jgi:putative transposase